MHKKNPILTIICIQCRNERCCLQGNWWFRIKASTIINFFYEDKKWENLQSFKKLMRKSVRHEISMIVAQGLKIFPCITHTICEILDALRICALNFRILERYKERENRCGRRYQRCSYPSVCLMSWPSCSFLEAYLKLNFGSFLEIRYKNIGKTQEWWKKQREKEKSLEKLTGTRRTKKGRKGRSFCLTSLNMNRGTWHEILRMRQNARRMKERERKKGETGGR